MILICVLLIFFTAPLGTHAVFESNYTAPQTRISLGELQGYHFTTVQGETINIYKKIPFAKPPIGDLRWKKPERPDSWEGVRDATKFSAACPSKTSLNKEPATGYSEDCLYFNVYAGLQCTSESPCPVIFYIHGGLLKLDTPVTFEDEVIARNFASKGLVFVISAYRLGYAGILSLEDEDVLPSNLALWDMLHGLQFSRGELLAFGGDVNQITLMGHSSGATQAIMFAMSPGIAKRDKPFNLFHRVIAMSPSMFFESDGRHNEISRAIAAGVGCNGTSAEILECLRPIPFQDLLNSQAAYEALAPGKNLFEGVVMRPPLFPMKNVREMRKNPVPISIMTGSISGEYDYLFDESGSLRPLGYRNQDGCFQKFLRDKKSGHVNFTSKTPSQSVFLTTELHAEAMAKAGADAFLYQYDYTLSHRTRHVDDLSLVMGIHPRQLDENELWLSEFYPSLFANFALTGKPHPDWTKLDPKKRNYFSIDHVPQQGAKPQMRNGYHSDVIDYWTGEVEAFDIALSKMLHKNPSSDALQGYREWSLLGVGSPWWRQAAVVAAVSLFFIAIGFCLGCCVARRKHEELQPLLHRRKESPIIY